MEKRIATGTEFAEKMDRVYQHLEGAESEAYLIAQMEMEKEHSFVTALVPWFVGLLMGFLGAHFFDNSRQL